MWPEFPSVAFFSCQANLIKMGAELENKQTRHLSLCFSLHLLSLLHHVCFLQRPISALFFPASIFHFCCYLLSSPSYSVVSPICPHFLSNYGLPQQNSWEQVLPGSGVEHTSATSASRRTINPHYCELSCLFRSVCWSSTPVPTIILLPIEMNAVYFVSTCCGCFIVRTQQNSVIA